MKPFYLYLLIINVIGFLGFLIDCKIKKKSGKEHREILFMIIGALGGSLGVLIAILIFDRKPEKANMMSRIFVLCVFVIELILLIMIMSFGGKQLTFAFWTYFANHMWLLYYLIAVNVIAIALYGIDKLKAKKEKRRIKIVTLLGIAFIGGGIGSLIAMYLFRHKTQKDYFYIGVPLILIMHLEILFFLMNI